MMYKKYLFLIAVFICAGIHAQQAPEQQLTQEEKNAYIADLEVLMTEAQNNPEFLSQEELAQYQYTLSDLLFERSLTAPQNEQRLADQTRAKELFSAYFNSATTPEIAVQRSYQFTAMIDKYSNSIPDITTGIIINPRILMRAYNHLLNDPAIIISPLDRNEERFRIAEMLRTLPTRTPEENTYMNNLYGTIITEGKNNPQSVRSITLNASRLFLAISIRTDNPAAALHLCWAIIEELRICPPEQGLIVHDALVLMNQNRDVFIQILQHYINNQPEITPDLRNYYRFMLSELYRINNNYNFGANLNIALALYTRILEENVQNPENVSRYVLNATFLRLADIKAHMTDPVEKYNAVRICNDIIQALTPCLPQEQWILNRARSLKNQLTSMPLIQPLPFVAPQPNN